MSGLIMGMEKVAGLWDELRPLLEMHYAEIAHFRDIPLDPDIDTYNALESLGRFRAYIVRKDGQIVGYAGFLCGPALHYKGSLQACEDVVFVHPDHRRGYVAMRFLDYCHRDLKAAGYEIAWHHVKKAHPALGVLLERSGFELVDLMYARRL